MPPYSFSQGDDATHSTTHHHLPAALESSDSHLAVNLGPDTSHALPGAGGQVLTRYGRGTVLDDVANHQQHIPVELSSWRLAGSSRVTCYLLRTELRVLTTEPVENMLLEDQCRLAGRIKTTAAELYNDNQFGAALDLFTWAVELCTELLQIEQLPKHERADLLVHTIKNSNHVGQCCAHLELWDRAVAAAESSLALLDALSRKQQPTVAPIQSSTTRPVRPPLSPGSSSEESAEPSDSKPSPELLALIGQARLFGECRVKALLILAQACHHLGDDPRALTVLDDAQTVVRRYATTDLAKQTHLRPIVKQFMVQQKKIKKLRRSIQKPKSDATPKSRRSRTEPSPSASEVAARERHRKVWFWGEEKRDQSSNEPADGADEKETRVDENKQVPSRSSSSSRKAQETNDREERKQELRNTEKHPAGWKYASKKAEQATHDEEDDEALELSSTGSVEDEDEHAHASSAAQSEVVAGIPHITGPNPTSTELHKAFVPVWFRDSPFGMFTYSALLASGLVGTMVVTKYLLKAKRTNV